jgi:hypothetical protein
MFRVTPHFSQHFSFVMPHFRWRKSIIFTVFLFGSPDKKGEGKGLTKFILYWCYVIIVSCSIDKAGFLSWFLKSFFEMTTCDAMSLNIDWLTFQFRQFLIFPVSISKAWIILLKAFAWTLQFSFSKKESIIRIFTSWMRFMVN